MDGMYHFLVSFKSRGEVASSNSYPSAFRILVLWCGANLILLSLLFSILAHSAPVSAARMAILFGFPFHNSSTLLACPCGPRSLNGLVIASGTLDARAAVGVNHRSTSTTFALETNFAVECRFFKTLLVVATVALVLI